jgi:hypothetical protein
VGSVTDKMILGQVTYYFGFRVSLSLHQSFAFVFNTIHAIWSRHSIVIQYTTKNNKIGQHTHNLKFGRLHATTAAADK